MLKFGLLTCVGSPLTVPLVEEMRKAGQSPFAILVDGKASEKDLAIDRARLRPDFPFLDLHDLHLESPTYFVKNHNSEPSVDLIKKLGIDYLVNAGTPRILKAPILSSVRGVLNCHPGILPKYRGCTCLEWSIYNGDAVGATAHLMSEKIDMGPVLLAETMAVNHGETYETVRTNMLYHQARVLAQAMVRLEQGETGKNLPEGSGQYHKPIPGEFLAIVKQKLIEGSYRSP